MQLPNKNPTTSFAARFEEQERLDALETDSALLDNGKRQVIVIAPLEADIEEFYEEIQHHVGDALQDHNETFEGDLDVVLNVLECPPDVHRDIQNTFAINSRMLIEEPWQAILDHMIRSLDLTGPDWEERFPPTHTYFVLDVPENYRGTFTVFTTMLTSMLLARLDRPAYVLLWNDWQDCYSVVSLQPFLTRDDRTYSVDPLQPALDQEEVK